MDNLIDDQFSTTLGRYIKNCFFIRFKSDADLQREGENPSPCAVSIHAHEFVHYFHNISTTSGIMSIILNHALVFMATHYLIKNEKGITISSENSSVASDISYFVKNLSLINGWLHKIPVDDNSFTPTDKWEISDLITFNTNEKYFSGCFLYQVRISHPSNKKDKNVNGILYIGLDFITEGVAYEIERELFKRNNFLPSEIDKSAPSYPYLAYEPVVNYLVGRPTTPEERIVVGNAALMHVSPSQGLVDACRNLSKGESFFKDYFDGLMKDFYLSITEGNLKAQLSHIQSFWSRTDKLEKPFERYVSIINSTSKVRLKYPQFELSFLSKEFTADNFFKVATSFAESFVFQEKMNKKAIFTNHAHNLPTDDDLWLDPLRSAIHFIQQHIRLSFNKQTGLVEDGKIEKTECLKNVMCPFSGACEVEKSRSYPQQCKNSPWLSKSEENGVCFYIAGIMSITPSPVK